MIELAKEIFGNKKVYLLIDDTLILKIYSRYIEGACDHHDSGDKRNKRSLCSVTVMLTDCKTAIPIDQLIWTSKKFKQAINHKKKWELAQELINTIKKHIAINMVIMDGLYAAHAMITWLVKNKI